jgi:hypothetical protein
MKVTCDPQRDDNRLWADAAAVMVIVFVGVPPDEGAVVELPYAAVAKAARTPGPKRVRVLMRR